MKLTLLFFALVLLLNLLVDMFFHWKEYGG